MLICTTECKIVHKMYCCYECAQKETCKGTCNCFDNLALADKEVFLEKCDEVKEEGII